MIGKSALDASLRLDLRRTSASDPLRLDRVPVPGRPGRLSLTICPGKRDGVWNRDLATDVAALVAAGVRHVVYLLESRELSRLGVDHYEEALRAAGIQPRHLPIPDGGTLGPGGFDQMLDTVDAIRMRLALGEHVVVHCRGGLGRAGTVAACVLVSDGMAAEDAIVHVRRYRSGAVENPMQEAFIEGFEEWLDAQGLRSLGS